MKSSDCFRYFNNARYQRTEIEQINDVRASPSKPSSVQKLTRRINSTSFYQRILGKKERESFTKHLLLFASWIECNVLIEVNRPIRYPIFPEALNEANSNDGLNVGVARQQTPSPSGKKESIPRRTSNLNSWPSTLLYSTRLPVRRTQVLR